MEPKIIVAQIPGKTVKSKTGKTFTIAARVETFRVDDQGRWTLDGAGAVLECEVIDMCRRTTNWSAIHAEHFPMFGFHRG